MMSPFVPDRPQAGHIISCGPLGYHTSAKSKSNKPEPDEPDLSHSNFVIWDGRINNIIFIIVSVKSSETKNPCVFIT